MKKLKFGLALALLLGGFAAVGAVVAPSANEVKRVEAATQSLTISYTDFNTSSYANNNGNHTFGGVGVYTNQVYQGSGSVMQWQKDKAYMYSTSALAGSITSIQLTSVTGGTFSIYSSTSKMTTKPTSATGSTASNVYTPTNKTDTYFYISCASATGKLKTIVINYEVSDATKYTTDFYMNDGTDAVYESVVTDEGEEVDFPEVNPGRNGYLFAGWYDAAEGGNEVRELFAEDDASLYAHWNAVTYTVSFETDEHVLYDGGDIDTDENGAIVLPEVEMDDNFTFDGWYDGDKLVGRPGDTYIPSSDVVLVGKADAQHRYVEFKNNSSDLSQTITTISDYLNRGSEYVSMSSASYVYKGLTGLKFSSSNNNGSLTLKLDQTYNVTSVKLGAAKYSSDSPTIAVNNLSALSVKTNSVEEYSFDVNQETDTLTIKASKRLYLKTIKVYFVEADAAKYTTTFDANGGTIDGETTKSIEATDGSSISLPIPTYEGYEFLGWYDAAEGGNKVDEVISSETNNGKVYYAHWLKVSTFSITPANFDSLEGFETSGVVENTSGYADKEFNFEAGAYLTSTCITGVRKIVTQVYGTYDNISVYAANSDSGTPIAPTKVAITNGIQYTYELDGADAFYIKNTSTYTVYMYNIDIVYSGTYELPEVEPTLEEKLAEFTTNASVGFSFTKSGEDYSFSNVRLSFRGTISAELYEEVIAAGVTGAGIECSIEGEEAYTIDCSANIGTDAEGNKYVFGSLLVPEGKENIEVTAKAFVTVDGARLYLASTSHSLVSAVSAYLGGAVELTEEQLAAVTALAASLGINA